MKKACSSKKVQSFIFGRLVLTAVLARHTQQVILRLLSAELSSCSSDELSTNSLLHDSVLRRWARVEVSCMEVWTGCQNTTKLPQACYNEAMLGTCKGATVELKMEQSLHTVTKFA